MEQNTAIRVLIADDHTLTREALIAILDYQAGICVVGAACNGQEVVDFFHRLRPDITLMDISMPLMNGIEATAKILSEFPAALVICISIADDGRFALARRIGAVACLFKDAPIGELLETIHSVYLGSHEHTLKERD